jgi:hypothetical protein
VKAIKEEFPLDLERAFRLAIGGRDRAERFRLFRGYWRMALKQTQARYTAMGLNINVPDNTDAMILFLRQNGVDDAWFRNIRDGVTEFRATERAEHARKAIKARWSKKRRKSR